MRRRDLLTSVGASVAALAVNDELVIPESDPHGARANGSRVSRIAASKEPEVR
jgi:hypothetical protein